MNKRYEFLEHTADIKFRLYGKNLKDIFENAVRAMSEILAKGNQIKSVERKHSRVEGKDDKETLYNLIDEVVYLLDAENFIAAKAVVSLRKGFIEVLFYGDNSERYKDLDHVKAATYSEMYINQTKKGWEAQVVVDV